MKIYLIIFYFILNYSFSQENKVIETEIGSIFFNDSLCFKEINRAKNDIQNNIFHYFIGDLDTGDYGHISMPIFISNLSKYNIKVNFLKPKTHYFEKHPHCYEFVMNNSIKKKYGDDFIENELIKAKKTYTLENPDLLIIDGEKYVTTVIYANTKNSHTQNKDIENDLFNNFVIPNGQKKIDKKSIGVYAWFTLCKDGKIKNCNVELYFYEFPSDKKYFKYYKKHIVNFIKNAKWIPYASDEIKVDKQILLYFNR